MRFRKAGHRGINLKPHKHIALHQITARSVYFSQIIDNNQSNPRHLFHTINRLLKVNGISLPVSNKLCNDFLHFFSSKIGNVYKLIQVAPVSSSTVCRLVSMAHGLQLFLKLSCSLGRYHV